MPKNTHATTIHDGDAEVTGQLQAGTVAVGNIVLSEDGGQLTVDGAPVGSGGEDTNHEVPGGIAIGTDALTLSVADSQNIAIGREALKVSTYGWSNLAIGNLALNNLDDGGFNIALGNAALYSATVAAGNTAVGSGAGAAITEGVQNTLVGTNTCLEVTTGSNNIAVGYNSGTGVDQGNDNIFIGATANAALDTTNSVVIGTNAQATADNQVVLGNTNTEETKLSGAVVVGNGTTGALTLPIATGAGDVTADKTFHTFICDGETEVTLPAASECQGRVYVVKKAYDDEETVVTITPDGTDVIDGEENVVLTALNQVVTIQSNGINWFII